MLFRSQSAALLLLIGATAAVRIPDYWNDSRYQGTWTWAKANEPRYGNETSWWESTPAGYNGQDIFHASVIGAQESAWNNQNVVQPYLLQTDSNIPDYWNDHRYSADYGWQAANNPRFGNETGFIESSPAGYKGPDLMDAAVIASQEATYGQQNTNQPFLA